MKNCISCGFPMRTGEDYHDGNTGLEYCIHCSDESGKLKSYEEKLEDMTNFIIQANGLDSLNARMAAKEVMMRMPAWEDHGKREN